MNWLAHLLLSEPTPAFRLGNLLPDLVSGAELSGLPPEFQRGILLHRQIDAYTGSHPIFRRSLQRLRPPFRRYGGILIDVFYDHFLARDWRSFSPKSLPDFASEVYASFDRCWADLPPEIHRRLQRMRSDDLLCSYREIRGIAMALRGISGRLRRPFDLAASISILESEHDAFHEDFTAFFPDLLVQVWPPSPSPGQAPSRAGVNCFAS